MKNCKLIKKNKTICCKIPFSNIYFPAIDINLWHKFEYKKKYFEEFELRDDDYVKGESLLRTVEGGGRTWKRHICNICHHRVMRGYKHFICIFEHKTSVCQQFPPVCASHSICLCCLHHSQNKNHEKNSQSITCQRVLSSALKSCHVVRQSNDPRVLVKSANKPTKTSNFHVANYMRTGILMLHNHGILM